jgi:hypothetical protein
MINWLKRLVAGRELDELERWRVECNQARRWLGEFPDVISALDHLSASAACGFRNISALRDEMRRRRDANPGPFTAASAQHQRPVRVYPAPVGRGRWEPRSMVELHPGVTTIRQHLTSQAGWTDEAVTAAERAVATDWDVANVNDAMLAHIHSTAEWRACNVHSEPAPGRIDYRFLGVTGEES